MKELSNCIGYAYHELGLIKEEKPTICPTLKELYKKFERVWDLESADLIAIMEMSADGPVAAHLAVVNPDKRTVRHRKGFGKPVEEGEAFAAVESYRLDPEVELIFLKKK